MLVRLASLFRMSDGAWRRHANPWSVWTRFAAIPAFAVAMWSRAWIGWWSLVPVALVLVWLAVNPHVFPPVGPTGWAALGIYGEREWLLHRDGVSPLLRRRLLLAALPGIVGGAAFIWGLYAFAIWPVLVGGAALIVSQLWRIGLLGRHYRTLRRRGSATLW